jgi:hypothetical protein
MINEQQENVAILPAAKVPKEKAQRSAKNQTVQQINIHDKKLRKK